MVGVLVALAVLVGIPLALVAWHRIQEGERREAEREIQELRRRQVEVDEEIEATLKPLREREEDTARQEQLDAYRRRVQER